MLHITVKERLYDYYSVFSPFAGCLRVPSRRYSDRKNIHNQLQGGTETRIDSDIPIHVSTS